MSLVDWSRGEVAAWDWGVLGCRSQEDLKRIKNGKSHGYDRQEGWAFTGYDGGRAKLAGKKAGTRPWKAWRVCLCPGGKHRPLAKDIEYRLDRYGNPREHDIDEITWTTECPINCCELILKGQYKRDEGCPMMSHARIYRKWNKKDKGGFGTDSEGDPMKLVKKWFKVQGVETEFDANAGRKGLGRWLSLLNVPYNEGLQIHGDLEGVWLKHYQPGLTKTGYSIREQSLDPKIATLAVRKFAAYCGRGKPPQVTLDVTQRLLRGLMEAQGKGDEADRLILGIPDQREVIDLAQTDFEQQHCLLVDDLRQQRKKRRKLTVEQAWLG